MAALLSSCRRWQLREVDQGRVAGVPSITDARLWGEAEHPGTKRQSASRSARNDTEAVARLITALLVLMLDPLAVLLTLAATRP
jgi:hypothetical protein